MLKWKIQLSVLLACVVAAIVLVRTQVRADAPRLTATDYAEIEHLIGRYPHGADSKAYKGALYASVWTKDAVFHNPLEYLTPLDNIVKYGRSETGQPVPITASGHQAWTILIEPAPWGATARAYFINGSYYDTLVKISEGWRFKARNFRWDIAFPDSMALSAGPDR